MPRKQLVENHTQTVNIADRRDPIAISPGMLRAHVRQRAHDPPRLAQRHGDRNVRVTEMREAKIKNLRVPISLDQDIRGLQVAMNHSLLVGVRNSITDLQKKLQSLLL